MLKQILNHLRKAPAICLALALSACASTPTLMPTPNIYLAGGYPELEVPSDKRSQSLNLLYVTDRAPEPDSNNQLHYGSQRSASMAWGEVNVVLGKSPLDWTSIVQSSGKNDASNRPRYIVESILERGRFPASPYPFRVSNGSISLDSKLEVELTGRRRELIQEISARLEKSMKKDVVMFVHGFNNSFDEAAFTLAGVWHFLSRDGVPLVYSWPAANGGLTGYFTDRESGEYTVYHLKETLRALSAVPDVENIHIIAHSRGTDVTTSALRELVIEARASGSNPRSKLKIANLILAAPDLDFGVIRQRLMAEQFGPAFGQITIYTSEKDKALGISQFLMSGLRFGRLKSTDIAHDDRDIFKSVGNVSFIDVKDTKGFLGHGYFHENPGASSDLIRLIRYQAKPGSKLRPLKQIENNFWKLMPGYPGD